MKIIDIPQGSQDWLDFRKTHITGTDAAAILGLNPWCSPKKLWSQKLGLELPEPMNDRMKRGQELEGIARQILIEETGINFKPVVAVHNIEDWAMASLDGISDCRAFMCEIKCPNKDTHELAIVGQVKEYYRAQMMHCLFVTGCSKCYYMSYYPEHGEPIAIIEVFPNDEYIEAMVAEERNFYENYLTAFREPEEASFKFKMKAPK